MSKGFACKNSFFTPKISFMATLGEVARFIDSVTFENFVDTTAMRLKLLSKFNSTGFSEVNVEEVKRRFEKGKKVNFVFLNTFLMDAVTPRSKKPATKERSFEIGKFLTGRSIGSTPLVHNQKIDIAAMAEVWKKDVASNILQAWPTTAQPQHTEVNAKKMGSSNGLMLISQTFPIEEVKIKAFEKATLMGAEVLAEKGVMMVTLNPGIGSSRLQIFVTHMNTDSGPRADKVRESQIKEIGSFIASNTRMENGNPKDYRILVGDFNMGPTVTPKIYKKLQDMVETLGMVDLWEKRNGTPGYTSNMDESAVAAQICSLDPKDQRFCDDMNVPQNINQFTSKKKGHRIDFMFVSKPSIETSFIVDFSRPRRMRIPRATNAHDYDKIAFVSDHLGLFTNLLISPKA